MSDQELAGQTNGDVWPVIETMSTSHDHGEGVKGRTGVGSARTGELSSSRGVCDIRREERRATKGAWKESEMNIQV